MSINLAEIQQKIDRLLFNIAEQNRRAYQLFYDPNPQDVELPQLDENGNLITVKIPNRALIKKQMWDDIGSAIGQWNKVLYVNQAEGDDNNIGTADSPLRSLQTAITRIPIGGVGTIVLSSDYTLEKIVTGENRVIKIVGSHLNSDGSPVITLRNDPENPDSRIFIGSGTKLILKRLIIEANNNGNSAGHWTTLLKIAQAPGTALYIGEWNSSRTTKIVLNHTLLNIESAITTFAMRCCEITASDSQNLVATWGAGHFLFAAENVVADDTVTLPNVGWN